MSLSIAAQNSAGSLDELVPLIRKQAMGDLQAIFCPVEERIAAHGIGWPT
ncbi:hypothetical protein [Granulicella sp. dw_53]|nr:hypothetical protein [Granulicella sp. dw_53]